MPAAISSAWSALNFSTEAVSDATSSAFEIESGGVNNPVPVIDTDTAAGALEDDTALDRTPLPTGNRHAPDLRRFCADLAVDQDRWVRTSERSRSMPSPLVLDTQTMSPGSSWQPAESSFFRLGRFDDLTLSSFVATTVWGTSW